MGALDQIVRSGKALYVGISQYKPKEAAMAARMLRDLGTPCLIHQPNYSMFDRWIEQGLTDMLEEEGIGCIAFSPLAQGMLTHKYIKGIPADSRASKAHSYLKPDVITPAVIDKVIKLNDLAKQRGQVLAQMAVAWVLHNKTVTSALIGASKVVQIEEAVAALDHQSFSKEELQKIDSILAS